MCDEMEFEIEFVYDGDNPGLDKYHVHFRCFGAIAERTDRIGHRAGQEMRWYHLPVFTNWMHCPWFLKPKDFQPSFLQSSLLAGTGAVKEVICVRQISMAPSSPMYSLADQKVLPSASTVVL